MIYYKKKIQQDVGATAIEYGILSALIAVVTIVALQSTGTNLRTTYCTIANELSKAIGGAGGGGCSSSTSVKSGANSPSSDSHAGSGGGSIGIGGNGNAGPSTGSVDNTNSLADGATIEQVENGLQDELDPAYIPSQYSGGRNIASEMTFGALNIRYSDAMPNLAQALKGINDKDPITNVFGTYHRTGVPITDYSTVMERLQWGGGALKAGNEPGIDVTTASGKVYHLNTFNGHVLGPTENKK